MKDQIEQLAGSDRELVVVALQALHRERLTAYQSVATSCELAGKKPPERDLFGLHEINTALRRAGAAPC